MDQELNTKVCYFCCVYFGDRRSSIEQYKEDRLCYLREHVKSLQEFNHNLDKIIFVFNLDPEHLVLFQRAKEIIPRKILNSNTEIIVRENYGMSYAAFDEVYRKYRTEFDYYIFNEDDYYFNDNNFDRYLVNKFNSYVNIGYLSSFVANPAYLFQHDKTHAGNSVGIVSSEVLEKIFQKFGCLPHPKKQEDVEIENYISNEVEGQIAQSHEIFKLGYNIFDIREDYSCPHHMGSKLKHQFPEFDHFVDHFFYWNKPLILPASIKFNVPTFFVRVMDPQYQRKRSCYIVNLQFNERKYSLPEFQIDVLALLKAHIKNLQDYYHNIDKIIFSFIVSSEDYSHLNSALKIIPDQIQNTPVDILMREKNVESIFSSFSEIFKNHREEYDYFIFNDGNYFLVENNWDQYLITKYNCFPNPGYLCALREDLNLEGEAIPYVGCVFGISSSESLDKIWGIYGCIPNSEDLKMSKEEEKIVFSRSFGESGLGVYDIREEYRLSLDSNGKIDQDIWRWFWWNEKDLIVPAIILFDQEYTWYESWYEPHRREKNL